MARGKDLIKNTGILFVAKTSTQVVSFFMLPLYTSLLSTAEYGQLDIYSSLVMLIVPFVTMQLEQSIFRFLVGKSNEEDIKKTISSAGATLIITFSTVAVIYLIAVCLIGFQYAIPLLFYYGTIICSTVMYQVCRGFGENTVYGIATFGISFTTVSLNILFVAIFKLGVEGVIISTAIAHFIGSLYMILKTRVLIFFKIQYADKSAIKEMLTYSIPLIFNQISSWAINYSDRFIILAFWGIGMNGIFSVAHKFSNILNTFFNVFNLAWTENVVKNIGDKDVTLYANKIVTITIQIYFSLIAGIMNLLPFVFQHLVNRKYAAAYFQIPLLLIAAAFSGISASLGSIYIAFKKTKSVAATTIMSGIVNVVIHLFLVRFIGLYAASLSSVIAFMILFVYRYINIQSFFSIRFEIKKIGALIIVLLVAWIAYCTKNPFMIIIGILINITNIVLIAKSNWKELRSLVKK